MVNLFNAAKEFQEFFIMQNIPFCFIGGIANFRWGEIRTTNDLDITVLCGFGNEEKLAQKILSRFNSRIENPIEFCKTARILLLTSKGDISVDISLSGLDYEEKMINNATNFEIYEDILIKTCSAEDLVVMKAFANRPKDWSDIKGILNRQGNSLNSRYILNNLSVLAELKDDPVIVANLTKMLSTVK